MLLEGLQVERETISARVASELRTRILAGTIGPGTPLTEESLVRSVRVARSTVREALNQLVAEGLLTRAAGTRIIHVSQLTEDEVRDIFRARRFLELAAVDAAAAASAEARRSLREAVEAYGSAAVAGDAHALVDADIRCHTALVGLLGSSHLVELYAALLKKLRLAEVMAGQPGDGPTVDARHRAFLTALERGQVARAKNQLAARLAVAEAEISAVFRSPGSSAAGPGAPGGPANPRSLVTTIA